MLTLVNTPTGQNPLAFHTIAEPQPAANEALVAVHASSLHRGELIQFRMRQEGWRFGEDIAGIVIKAATDGSGPEEGTRVVGLVSQAGWSQRIAAPTDCLVPLPDTLSFAEAVTLPVAGLTALRTLRYGGFLLGQRVLVTGASGGVGHLAVQLATLAGAQVTGVVSHADRGAFLRERGATAVVTSQQEAEGLFDLVLESVAGPSFIGSIRHVAPNGTVVVFGGSSGESVPFDGYVFLGHENARVQTFFLYGSSGIPEPIAADLRLLVSLTVARKLSPYIGWRGNWRDINQAITALRDRQIIGKAVFSLD
ncbi:MAG TPA: zinc-binding dehydrogenase [Ktedonosporobacter sp.]|nr:zinc-binding dehydrogenase [Ktedonosporobacter sp.]